ncbi:hypothetical protein M0R45_000348 [Rubus argutus]|uniref:K Homology domain-containing protein n=1 Tax=Rubus argutus TaxID=59490 RepID=A0AAW1VPG7_RUBAR
MGSTFLSLPAKRSISSTTMSSESNSENGSSKRSRPRQPPLTVPPGHVAFRMLCHASRIGGVIGKSGCVIKQLQQATGAKIRIEEPPLLDSPDRVVVVIAPSAIRSRISLSEEEIEVSKAQEALLRVFERILEVAAETGAIGVGVGVVSCRFLAETAQVGSVIGKGGKVVEKIRKETGCKIRVLNEKLPVCAAPSDEMVEIEGDILAVKKALIAVSGRLQDCPPVEKTRMTGSRPIEAVPRETLSDIRVDHVSQRNSMITSLPSSSMGYASGVRPPSIEAERIPTLDTRTLQQEVTFKILCANDRVGGVIGKGGAIVRALQNETGATISVGGSVAECDERLITITASENPESRYSPAQKAVVLVFSRSVEAGIEKGQDSSSKGSPNARLVVPTSQVGCLLGKGGAIVSEIRKVTGTGIRIIGGDQVPKCALENDEVVQVSGDFSNVQDALYNITGRLRDNLFSSTVNNSGRRNSSTLLTDTIPYGRLRDPAPIGFQSSSSVGVTHGLSRHTTLSQSMDHLGLNNLDHPSSPRPWASQMVAPRGISDTGRGLTSLKSGSDLGSGSKSAIVTNTTVEIIVPENVVGSVYGENGTNLARLRQISGAKVIVHEPRPGTTDRIIVISGTPDETQAAQSLLHAFILTGPS